MSATAYTAAPPWPSFRWLHGYRELLTTFLRRELRAKYKGSALGVLWSYLYPLFMMGVYTLVFSYLVHAVRVPHYALFVLSGLAVWTFFQGAVQLGAASIVGNGTVIKQVWFPRELVPLAVVLAQGLSSLVMFVVLIPVNIAVVPHTASTVALALPILVCLGCLAIGLSWALSTAVVFFRDVEHLLSVFFLPWFFLTPVLYGLDQIPNAETHPILIPLLRYFNPVAPYVESIRGVILQGQVPGPGLLVYVFVVGPVVALLGLWIFQRFEDQLAVEL